MVPFPHTVTGFILSSPILIEGDVPIPHKLSNFRVTPSPQNSQSLRVLLVG
jgi:hypothetical protein